jgi:hypothetical protein
VTDAAKHDILAASCSLRRVSMDRINCSKAVHVKSQLAAEGSAVRRLRSDQLLHCQFRGD